ncbi:MAG: Eco57I restriction-modification methylase domain-containing protein, partial [Microcystaceae cyanobacterium]
MTHQLFGLAITELTALLSRRTVYCSKVANGQYSVCENFGDEQGNIIYSRLTHTWHKGKCVFCGANEKEYERGEALEFYAYPFIHVKHPEELFKGMKFDVIVGNPPYQLSDGGFGRSATPIYHLFVETAKKINPRYLIMIIPARWYSGGKGLDDFRKEMLEDDRLQEIHDFPEAVDCFPGVQIKGGVCYFLWERENRGLCKVSTHKKDKIISTMVRPLLEKNCDTFIRYNEAISILEKVRLYNEPSLKEQISSSKPFGLRTNFKGKKHNFPDAVSLYQNSGVGYVKRE